MINAIIRTALIGMLVVAMPVATAEESDPPNESSGEEICLPASVVCFQPPCVGFTPSNEGMNEPPPGGIAGPGPGGNPHDGPLVPGWWYVGLDQGVCGSIDP